MAAVEQDLAKLADTFKAKVDEVYGALATRLTALETEHAAIRAAYGDVVGELDKFDKALEAAVNDLRGSLGAAKALQTTPKP